MKAYIVTTIVGVFAVDDMNKVISFRPFQKDPFAIADKIKDSNTELLFEEKELYEETKKRGYRHVVFGRKKESVEEAEADNHAEKFIRENLFSLAIKYNVVKDRLEFNHLVSKVNIELTKGEIKKAVKKDSIIVQVNGAVEETEKAANIMIERLREWYGLHFPEMDRAVNSHEKFVKLVEKFGRREKIDDYQLRRLAEKSIGINISDADAAIVQSFASEIRRLQEMKTGFQDYLERLLREVAPNFTAIAGTNIAAKLLSRAGGLDKLARMTSNTIQLLGAEKALFRFLHSKGKARSPKYGTIFSHQLIQNAPDEKRGKIARVLSSKLSMAAKIDYFSQDNKADDLKRNLEAKVKEILESKESHDRENVG